MTFEFFAEMAWKSALIAGAALALAFVLRSRAAADRALVLRIGVAMLLALPLISLMLPALQVVAFAAPEAPPARIDGAELAAFIAAAAAAPPAAAAAAPTIWDDPAPLLLILYLGGLAMAAARLLGGLVTLSLWTRRARAVDCPEWTAVFERLRWAAPHGERLRLLVSDEVPSPMSWGFVRPVVLIDRDTLDDPAEAEAILAHEIAHVARFDWPVLMMSRIAAALFWFNPLVWLLEREVVQQAEEAADCAAAERVEPVAYAQTLLSWAQAQRAGLPANSIAPSARALARRIRAVLDRRLRERPSGSAWTAFAILACLGIAAPVAAMELVAASRAEPAARAEVRARTAALAAAVARTPGASELSEAEIARIAAAAGDDALAELLPRIPEIVAAAMAAVEPGEIARITEEAMAGARVHARVDAAEIEAAVREAQRAVQVELRANSADIAAAIREAQRAGAVASARAHVDHEAIEAAVRAATADIPQQVARSLAATSEGLARGAEGMEAGARRMEEQARRLRSDRAYREQQIARARARGETVTHEDLLEAAEGMIEGAQGMREGAQGMREAAREMREAH